MAAPATPRRRSTPTPAVPILAAPILAGPARATLDSYVADVARHLQLSDWHLEVVIGDPGDDACAKVDAPYGQRRATITLGELFQTQSPTDQRDTIVHELLHLVLMPSWQYIDELLDAELGVRAARIAWLGYTQHVEYSIDQLASVIASTIALPPALTWGTPTTGAAPEGTNPDGATEDPQVPGVSGTDPELTTVASLAAGGTAAAARAGNPVTAGAGRPARRRVRVRTHP
jgi:hypothetical protein